MPIYSLYERLRTRDQGIVYLGSSLSLIASISEYHFKILSSILELLRVANGTRARIIFYGVQDRLREVRDGQNYTKYLILPALWRRARYVPNWLLRNSRTCTGLVTTSCNASGFLRKLRQVRTLNFEEIFGSCTQSSCTSKWASTVRSIPPSVRTTSPRWLSKGKRSTDSRSSRNETSSKLKMGWTSSGRSAELCYMVISATRTIVAYGTTLTTTRRCIVWWGTPESRWSLLTITVCPPPIPSCEWLRQVMATAS